MITTFCDHHHTRLLRKSPPPEGRRAATAVAKRRGGAFLHNAQPTPAPDGACPSREGIQADFLIHITPRHSGVGALLKIPRRGGVKRQWSRSAGVGWFPLPKTP